MDVNVALRRYLRHPDVSRWLFSTDPVSTVTPSHLANCFVYAIGFGIERLKSRVPMDVEDMLIVTSTVDNFVLGAVWGLGLPHLFANTSLMLNKQPIARRFAVDLSCPDALEFLEFDIFQDGKIVVAFRRFLQTHDGTLPCAVHVSLHAPSPVPDTLGTVIMRASLFEAPACTSCGNIAAACFCNFSASKHKPNSPIQRQTTNWRQFTTQFMTKARVGSVSLQMSAVLPEVGEVTVAKTDFKVVNVLQKGDSPYLNLLRRKAVHGLGVNVVQPRVESYVLPVADENDFTNLHSQFMSRKRMRVEGVDSWASTAGEDSIGSVSSPDSVFEIEDVFSVFPTMFDDSPVSSSDNKQLFVQPLPTSSVPLQRPPPIQQPLPQHGTMTVATATATAVAALVENVVTEGNTEAVADLGESLLGETDKKEGSGANMESTDSGMFSNSAIWAPPSLLNPLTPRSKEQRATFVKDLDRLLRGDGGGEHDTKETNGSEHEERSHSESSSMHTPLNDRSTINQQERRQQAQKQQQVSKERIGMYSAEVGSDVVESNIQGEGHGALKRGKRGKRKAEEDTEAEGSIEEERKHGCSQCSSRFKMRGDLQRHVKIVHEGKKLFDCSTCGKAFGHSGHLNRHINSVHLQKRRFKCPLCGFQFFQASHLQSHIGHIHGGKKGLECSGCGTRVKSQASLRVHMSNCEFVKVNE